MEGQRSEWLHTCSSAGSSELMRNCSVVRMPPKRRRREGRGWKRNKVNCKFCHLCCVTCTTRPLSTFLCFVQRNKPSQNEPEDKGVRGAGYTPIVKENARFVKYYQVMRVRGVSTWCTCVYRYIQVTPPPLPPDFI